MTMHLARRHVRWLLPLLVGVCAWIATVAIDRYEQDHPDGNGAVYLLIVSGGGGALLVTAVCVILAVRNGWRTRGAIRIERHNATVERNFEKACAAGWRDAQVLASQLAAGQPVEPLVVWGPVLRRDETAYLDVTVDVAQLASLPAIRPNWTAPEPLQIIATDKRLLVDANRWRSVWYASVVAFYPDLDQWQLTLDVEQSAPIQLTGPLVPVLTVYMTAALYGRDQLRCHPETVKLCFGMTMPPIQSAIGRV